MKSLFKNKKLSFFRLVVVSVILFSVSACKKDDSVTSYVLRFKANGTQIEYSSAGVTLMHTESFDSESYYMAAISAGTSADAISISVSDNEDFSVKTYDQSESTFGAHIVYIKKNGPVYYSDSQAKKDFKVVITKITDTDIRGTFSGTLSSSTEDDLVITNGEFVAKITTKMGY